MHVTGAEYAWQLSTWAFDVLPFSSAHDYHYSDSIMRPRFKLFLGAEHSGDDAVPSRKSHAIVSACHGKLCAVRQTDNICTYSVWIFSERRSHS